MPPVSRVLAKLRGRSLHELRERGAQWSAALLERRGLGADARALADGGFADRDFARRLRADAPATPEAWRAHWAARPTPRFFAGLDDPAATIAALDARWPHRRAAVVARADATLRGEFSFFGHAALSYGVPVDWHLDPLSGKRAPLAHWSRVPYLDHEAVGDHKVTWEVNRHQFLVPLGQAYWCTGDERYATAICHTIGAWIDANPPKRGINWASSLEVGFRSMSWLWALHFVRRSPSLTPALLRRVLESLYVHARHLETYLSTYFSPNTHLTGEALALFHLGVLLPELRAASRWRDLGWRVLIDELPRQIHADGVYFEQATYYQKYTLDFYVHLFTLARRNGIAVPGESMETLHRAATHVRAIMRPDGLLPLFGDDDGGRLTHLGDLDGRDVRPSLGAAAALFDDAALASAADGRFEDALWLFGPDALGRLDALDREAASAGTHAAGSEAFPVGGYFVLRRGEGSAASWLAVDCGPHGMRNGGHAHADVLSFELAVAGRPLVVDGGTYTYSGAGRNEFRGAGGHNAPVVDGEGSSEPSTASAFAWRSMAASRALAWAADEETACFVGAHDGFRRLADPVSCERTIVALHGRAWLVRDRLRGAREHRVELPVHLAPGLSVRPAGANLLDVLGPDGVRARIVALTAPGTTGSLEVRDGWVSEGYGTRERSAVVTSVVPAGHDCDAVTLFLAPSDDGSVPVVSTARTVRGWSVTLTTPMGGDTFVFGGGDAAGVTVDGELALVRTSVAGEVVACRLFGAGRVSRGGETLVVAGAGAWAAGAKGTTTDGAWRVRERAFTLGGSSDVRD